MTEQLAIRPNEDILNSTLNSAVVSPAQRQLTDEARIIKIQEKQISNHNDIVNDVESSSFTDTYRSSMIPGEIQVTVTSL